MRYWERPASPDIAKSEAFLKKLMRGVSDTEEEYVLDLDGRLIGKAGVWAKPEVGYILHPDHWGQGYVTDALRAILRRAFAKWPDLPHLTAEIDPRNLPSARVLTRLGFKLVRTGERNFLYGETEWCDTAYYQLDRPAMALAK